MEDLNVIKQRTAGGVPVYKFKTKLLLDALEDAGHEEILLISDVDIQFFGEVMPLVRQGNSSCLANQGIAGRDMCFQREFTELGVNIGFVAIRRTAAAIDFWNQVWEELPTGRHDQRIVNNLLYTEKMPALRWGCFPPEIWASSQVPLGEAMAHIAEAFARPSMEGLASPNGSYFTMPIGLSATMHQTIQVLMHQIRQPNYDSLQNCAGQWRKSLT